MGKYYQLKLERARNVYKDNRIDNLLYGKIRRAINKSNREGKKYFKLKNIVNISVGSFKLPDPRSMDNLGQTGRKFDPHGNTTLTKQLRNLSLTRELSKKYKFKDLYLEVAKKIGIPQGEAVVALNDLPILHEENCSNLQPPHIDAPEVSLTDIHGCVHKGHGKGFSGFLAITKGSLCIYNFSDTFKLTEPDIVDLNPGDVLIVPYGVVHGGNRNTIEEKSWKIFTDVNSGSTPDSTSQVWAIDGQGWTSLQPKE
jgi:hypothetical protein